MRWWVSEQAARSHEALLHWYDGAHRVLPWRRNARSRVRDAPEDRVALSKTWAALDLPQQKFAYRVWVSEVTTPHHTIPSTRPRAHSTLIRLHASQLAGEHTPGDRQVMCQQTRVETVVQYYDKWMRKWPTVQSLAAASLEQVNELWAGLGYYRRARFLLQGAQHVVDQLDGKFPSDVATLKKVRGSRQEWLFGTPRTVRV